MNSNLVAQNKMIKNKLSQIEDEIFELREQNMKKNIKQVASMSM